MINEILGSTIGCLLAIGIAWVAVFIGKLWQELNSRREDT